MTPADERRLGKAAGMVVIWTTERDRLVREAVANGGTLRGVAAACGLTHTAVAKIVRRGARP